MGAGGYGTGQEEVGMGQEQVDHGDMSCGRWWVSEVNVPPITSPVLSLGNFASLFSRHRFACIHWLNRSIK